MRARIPRSNFDPYDLEVAARAVKVTHLRHAGAAAQHLRSAEVACKMWHCRHISCNDERWRLQGASWRYASEPDGFKGPSCLVLLL